MTMGWLPHSAKSVNSLLPFIAVALVVGAKLASAAEPFLKPNDVIALVGGEDMVAAAECGHLELLLQCALPNHHLRVRSFAWEGDTVFEQPRDLNYPALEAQLAEIGATVVVMQFGRMESLAGADQLPEFIRAYERLIERVGAGGKRRVAIAPPTDLARATAISSAEMQVVAARQNRLRPRFAAERDYQAAIRRIALAHGRYLDTASAHPADEIVHRDGVHLNDTGQRHWAVLLAQGLDAGDGNIPTSQSAGELERAIRAKNRLWFHYYRPQNWAFLAGDRTEQPSSRDHKDPSKRWFPEEMKRWLPLIERKEKEIWALAAKASTK